MKFKSKKLRPGTSTRPFVVPTELVQKSEEQIQNEVCAFLRRYYRNVFYHVDLAGIRVSSRYQRKIIHDQQGPEGFPDIVVYERRGKFNGIVLEMKRETPYRKDGSLKKDKHLESQQQWLEQFRSIGFVTGFFWTSESAIKAISEYLSLSLD